VSEERRFAINVPVLARVEGEGALDVTIEEGRIAHLALRIFEPPRLFEKLLEGREFTEVPDMVARICGICPVAYQMSAVQALEAIMGIDPGAWVRAMRRVFYCGEWIESHCLHIHLLAAPDFLGCEGVAALAKAYPDEVRRGLRLQALGNDLITLFGARSVHPVGARVGGFHHAPSPAVVADLCARLRAALPEAAALVRWTASLPMPDGRGDYTCVALRHPHDYPMTDGRIVSSAGHNIDIADFDAHFSEHQVPHSTALHCLLEGESYLVGPLARLNLNLDRLPAAVRGVLSEVGLPLPSRNIAHSIVARAAEVYFAVGEALHLLESYQKPKAPYADVSPRSGIGFGCSEAPRGMLWHRYETGATGRIVTARIVPPTSQNQARIEADLRRTLLAAGLEQPAERLRFECERLIRHYDPCISCASHFLDLRLHRAPP